MAKELLTLKTFCLAAFESTHTALKCEKILKEGEVPFIIVPTPRDISASCGLAVKIRCEDLPGLKEVLAQLSGVYDLYEINKDEKGNNIKKIGLK